MGFVLDLGARAAPQGKAGRSLSRARKPAGHPRSNHATVDGRISGKAEGEEAMTKAGNGEGSIRSKPRADGRWEGRYHIEVGGVWKRMSVFGRTKAETARKLRDALS